MQARDRLIVSAAPASTRGLPFRTASIVCTAAAASPERLARVSWPTFPSGFRIDRRSTSVSHPLLSPPARRLPSHEPILALQAVHVLQTRDYPVYNFWPVEPVCAGHRGISPQKRRNFGLDAVQYRVSCGGRFGCACAAASAQSSVFLAP